jgi:hypothetical protein
MSPLADFFPLGLLGWLVLAWHLFDITRRRRVALQLRIALAAGSAVMGSAAAWLMLVAAVNMAPFTHYLWPVVAGSSIGACVLAWYLPGVEPVPLTSAQRWRKALAPLCAGLGTLAGYLLCLPFLLLLNRQQEREYDFSIKGWWTDELLAGVYPVGYIQTRAEAGEPPQSVCLRCGGPSYARLTRCVACGAPLPPRPELHHE